MQTITVTGNLAQIPELRFTNTGKAVTDLIVLSNTGRYQDGDWVQDPATRHVVTLWETAAENAAESLSTGDEVIVTGNLRTETYSDDNGDTRYVTKITRATVGVTLTRATVIIKRTRRSGEQDSSQ